MYGWGSYSSPSPRRNPICRPRNYASRININNFPVEILELIFITCLRTDLGPHRERAPLLLLEVCSHWHNVAVSTPSLWTRINLGFFPPSYTKLWIERSGNHALTIRIPVYLSSFYDRTKRNLEKTFDLLVEEAPRWQECNFELNDILATKFVMGISKTTERFTSLKVSVDYCSDRAVRKVITALESCAYLRHLEWHRPGLLGPITDLPLDRLVTISVRTSFSVEESFTFLSHCTSAVEISVYRVTDEYGTPRGYTPAAVTLPHLESLTLHMKVDPTNLLHRFIMPSLHTIDLTSEGPNSGLDTGSFRNFLWSSQCPLSRLRIHVMELSNASAVGVLSIPSVQSATDIEILYTAASTQVMDTLRLDGVSPQFIKQIRLRTAHSGYTPGILIKPRPRRSIYDF